MGGETASAEDFSLEEESTLEHDYQNPFVTSDMNDSLRDEIGIKSQNFKVDEGNGPVESYELGNRGSSASVYSDMHRRKRQRDFEEVLQSYGSFLMRSSSLVEAKNKILSYKPGAWIEVVGSMTRRDYDVPETTTLLLVGPKGSGKSSLINMISRVLENDKFAPERAQVEYNSSGGDGTCFLQEYMVPRGSTAFCLYDTRGLLESSSDNFRMLKRWMTKGVRHGELVISNSDGSRTRKKLKCKIRKTDCYFRKIKMVNFVIFVVNGVSVLKSMMEDEDNRLSDGMDREVNRHYNDIITEVFRCPYLSFKDDKPVVVVTHGDLLSSSDRARVRVHLGGLLSIPPEKQIFEIPGKCDLATELTILDMLRYSLEHADRHLPRKCGPHYKVLAYMLMMGLFCTVLILWNIKRVSKSCTHHDRTQRDWGMQRDWSTMRHLWMG